jgi:hypothetical protein
VIRLAEPVLERADPETIRNLTDLSLRVREEQGRDLTRADIEALREQSLSKWQGGREPLGIERFSEAFHLLGRSGRREVAAPAAVAHDRERVDRDLPRSRTPGTGKG